MQRRRGKTNVTVYGILTSGIEWRFVRLGGQTRHVSVSVLYSLSLPSHELDIQNFLGEILDAASRSSPTTTPVMAASNLEVIDFVNLVEAEKFNFSEPCLVTGQLKKYGESNITVLDEEGNPQELPYDTMLDVLEY